MDPRVVGVLVAEALVVQLEGPSGPGQDLLAVAADVRMAGLVMVEGPGQPLLEVEPDPVQVLAAFHQAVLGGVDIPPVAVPDRELDV